MATGQRVYKKMCAAKANNEPARVDRYHATVKMKTEPNKTPTLSNEALAGLADLAKEKAGRLEYDVSNYNGYIKRAKGDIAELERRIVAAEQKRDNTAQQLKEAKAAYAAIMHQTTDD